MDKSALYRLGWNNTKWRGYWKVFEEIPKLYNSTKFRSLNLQSTYTNKNQLAILQCDMGVDAESYDGNPTWHAAYWVGVLVV